MDVTKRREGHANAGMGEMVYVMSVQPVIDLIGVLLPNTAIPTRSTWKSSNPLECGRLGRQEGTAKYKQREGEVIIMWMSIMDEFVQAFDSSCF